MIRKIKFDKVHVINNLFSKEEVDFINKSLTDEHWVEDFDMNRSCYVNNISKNSYASDIYNNGISILKNEIEKDFNCKLSNEDHNTVVQYRIGWSLHQHVDGEDGVKTFSGYPSRDISSLVYLTEDFNGGKLIFSELNLEIEPTAGSAVYFPSSKEFRHEVTELLSGVRLVSTCFWHILPNEETL